MWLIRWPHPGAAASGSAAGGGSPAGGCSAAAAARQRRRLGVSSALTCRLAYRSAYPGAYPYLSGVTYRICVENHSCTKMFSLCLLCDSIPIRREIRIMFQLQAPPAFAYRSAGGSAAVGGSAAAAWQRRRLGVSSAFTCRLAYRSAYPGAYPYLSGVTYRICVDNHSCTKMFSMCLLCDSIPIRRGPRSLAPMLFAAPPKRCPPLKMWSEDRQRGGCNSSIQNDWNACNVLSSRPPERGRRRGLLKSRPPPRGRPGNPKGIPATSAGRRAAS